MNMSETALVTGGSGFVASHLIQQLLASGAGVNATVQGIMVFPQDAAAR